MKSRNLLIGIVIALVVVIGVFAMFSGRYEVPSGTPSQSIISPAARSTPPSGQVITEMTVKASEFKFEPGTLILKKGGKVRITFTNEGAFPHNFTITEMGVVSSTITSGQTTTVEFTPDKTGTFTYLCTVPTHADRGMKGAIIVQ